MSMQGQGGSATRDAADIATPARAGPQAVVCACLNKQQAQMRCTLSSCSTYAFTSAHHLGAKAAL